MVNKKENIGEEENKREPFWQELLSYVILLAIVFIVKKYVVSPIKVNGISMVPTLENKDYMILDKISYKLGEIKRFDIVVIKEENSYLIKRIIGLPGEKVEYKDNKLYVNGKYVKENYTRQEMDDYNIEEIGSKVIPEDSYFVLGDNRPVSKDSRYIGFIPRKDIEGKTKLILYPFSRFGIKK